ncbi:hypothetical protein pdam_00023216 [Pocillopora damicornis]|uniref:Endonuclease/exonuclease/phosphatase domain-containing protein n=1 Tax=Pocillopora damicornis TaxID=46731 RepID=A0A3M6UN77_POCDA|nr:hypothetical protein pdam_00023216 [Pocillopora damicornis]
MEPENVESICLNVKGFANTSYYICACYRSPNLGRVSDFISTCSTATDKMLKSKSEIIFLGDFNINMLQNDHNTDLLNEPTRVTNTSKSLIDVILVNRPEYWATSGSLQLGMSDHDLI